MEAGLQFLYDLLAFASESVRFWAENRDVPESPASAQPEDQSRLSVDSRAD